MITAGQIRAGRALLRWSARELAERAQISLPTVQRMEKAEGVPGGSTRTLAAVQAALEGAGIDFLPENGGGPGVRLRKR
ncbi:MAG: transcriptional regulator [Alphaproteobacteria bacterium]|jgi:transcriptional regulator with XRE-family HTH domain|nr:transcriptional regulator [Alphaproteobacteria bacterium]